MDSVQKMALVPHELLSTLDVSTRERAIQRPPTVAKVLDLDTQMKAALNEKGHTEEEKATQYAQLLRRYQTFSEQSRQKTPVTVQLVPASRDDDDARAAGGADETPTGAGDTEMHGALEREIVQSVPKAMAHKAVMLYNRLKSNPDVDWDGSGQFIFKGVRLNHTNILDLIHDVLRKRKTTPSPPGWQIFAQALASDKVPYELVGNPLRRKFIAAQTQKLIRESPATASSSKTPISAKKTKKKNRNKTQDTRHRQRPRWCVDTRQGKGRLQSV
jgi:hypothetical protein